MVRNVIFFCLFTLFFSCEKKEAPDQSKAPNIVLIFTDDQTYTSIQALGNTEIHTPNMDRMVNAGTTFTHAYNMGAWNGAVCLASRAMINSGRFVWNANAFRQNWKKGDSLALSQTWSKLMESQGYDTYMTGKWHVDAPADQIFQEAKHIRPGMPGDNRSQLKVIKPEVEMVDGKKVKPEYITPIGYNRPQDESDDSWSPSDPKFGGFWEGGKHWSEVLKDDAVSFIQKAKQKDNPFFMYLAFNAPHDPRQSPQEFVDRYPLENITLPESWLPEYPYKDAIGNDRGLRDEALAPFPRTPYAIKTHIQEYYAIITHLDQQIGLILDELEATGQMDNTYIFFTADHGLSVGRHGLLGKQSLFDHSIRVPLVMIGKDIPKGKKVDADVYLQDVMATSLDLAGVPKPSYVEFNSFLGLAKGEEAPNPYDAIYGAYVDFQRMIRKDGFKLIIYPKIAKVLLFDLNNDPEEMNNLADLPEQKEKVNALFQDLKALQKNMKDPLDLQPVYEDWLAQKEG